MTNASKSEFSSPSGTIQPQPAIPPKFRRGPALMWLALASAIMLWASFYPLNWGWLGWIALAPLLGLVRAHARPLRVYGAALVCGLAFFVPALQWMRVGHPSMYAAWLLLAFYCALYFPAAIYLLRYLNRRTRLPLVITLPIVWTALEFLRAHLISGFPWYYLAHTQHEFLSIIQICDVTGAYGLSALVAACNAIAFELLRRREWFRQLCEPGLRPEVERSHIGFQILGVAVVFCGFLIYGLIQLDEEQSEKGPLVVLIQPNVPQQIRNDAWVQQGNAEQDLLKVYVDLTQDALKDNPKPALIAWPESSYPSWIDTEDGFVPKRENADLIIAENHADAWRLARLWHTDFLFGTDVTYYTKDDKSERYNSAILVRTDGSPGGRYNKIHRVPFGEFLPFEWIPFMKLLAPYDFDYSVRAGDKLVRFDLDKTYTFGVLICYEDTDPTLARQYARSDANGPAVNFLMNVSNDGWFDGTSEHDQHLATCRFRAVEARKAIARSVNMGISAVIDGNGRIIALPGSSVANSKKIAGYVACNIPIDRRKSYYALFGDWLPWTCWILLASAFVYGWLRPAISSSPSLIS
jgi:apolipoprotein N-acyltransferase